MVILLGQVKLLTSYILMYRFHKEFTAPVQEAKKVSVKYKSSNCKPKLRQVKSEKTLKVVS